MMLTGSLAAHYEATWTFIYTEPGRERAFYGRQTTGAGTVIPPPMDFQWQRLLNAREGPNV